VGLRIARAFLDVGAAVVTCASPAFDRAPAARTDAERTRTIHLAADVRNDDDVTRVVQSALERFGRLDVLVNNAGGQPPTDIASAPPRFIRAIVELNLTAPMIFAQAAYRVIEPGGSIINISSQASLTNGGGGMLAPYGAAKGGLNHMTRSLAKAWGRKVRVNCVSIGWVRTEAMGASSYPVTRPSRSASRPRSAVWAGGDRSNLGVPRLRGSCVYQRPHDLG